MKKIKITRKRVLFTLLYLFLLALAYYIGGVTGFFYGNGSASCLSDSEAYTTSLTLIKLRNEDYRGAIDLLENRLDSEIMQSDLAKDSYQSMFNLYWIFLEQSQKETHGFLLSSIAEYRKQYPSTSMLPEVQEKIKTIMMEATKEIEKEDE